LIDILRALAGRRWCPWCLQWPSTLFDRLYNRLPSRLVILLMPYDRLVGHLGGGWHRAHHIPPVTPYGGTRIA
jgi:hypothetical protein